MKGTQRISLGTASLAVAIGGLIVTETALRHGWLAASGWKVLLQAFEAATVGGLADWFAVSALFREIPLPVIRRHTNIIIRNRRRIVTGIADMVQNRWLAPSVIRDHLPNFSASQYVLEFLSQDDHLESVVGILRDIIREFAKGIDAPEVAAFLERALQAQLTNFKFTESLGRRLGQRIRSRDHYGLWDTLLPLIERAAGEPDMKALFRRMVGRTIEAYKESGLLKRLVVEVAHGLNIVNEESIAAAFLSKVKQAVREARSDPSHPLRARIDAILIDFADQLARGDDGALSTIKKLQTAFIYRDDAREMLQGALRKFAETIENELQKSNSDLNHLMRRSLNHWLDDFRRDRGSQETVDRWINQAALDLIETRHQMIGQMVHRSLEKLSDLDLVGQIEDKVGRDLQYIRLNGAIVGGLAGAILACIKLLV